MAAGLEVGEQVFVPTSLIARQMQVPSAFYRTSVLAIVNRSARVDVGGGEIELVATSKCQRNIGILIISIGDFDSEASLIDPLSKSILQFGRILCSDDYVRLHKVRSIAELSVLWASINGAYSHIFIVGHGNGDALKFAAGGWVGADGLGQALNLPGISPKVFVNLSCELGKAGYGKAFSQLACCEAFIAPYHDVHGSIASHFVQSFLIFHLLHGETLKVAFRHARSYVPSSSSFRLWRNGVLTTDS